MRELDVTQAEHDSELLAGGRIFPASLALDIARAYAQKFGYALANSDSGESTTQTQPFLESTPTLGNQWITLLVAHGATVAVITTSAITGKTNVWRAPAGSNLLTYAEAVSALLVEQPISGYQIGSGGNYPQAIEPRPIFPPGHGLQFVMTITTNTSKTAVLDNVIMDARTQKIVAISPATPPVTPPSLITCKQGS